MSGECYQIFFNNQSSNCQNNASYNDEQKYNLNYTVNWGAILPKKYKKFRCSFVFKSEFYSSITVAIPFLSAHGVVSMNLGRMNNYDCVNPSKCIGTISPTLYLSSNYTPVLNGAAVIPPVSYYTSNNSENNDFYIDYPQNSTVNISINKFSNTPLTIMPNYILTLTLEGILESELDHSC